RLDRPGRVAVRAVAADDARRGGELDEPLDRPDDARSRAVVDLAGAPDWHSGVRAVERPTDPARPTRRRRSGVRPRARRRRAARRVSAPDRPVVRSRGGGRSADRDGRRRARAADLPPAVRNACRARAAAARRRRGRRAPALAAPGTTRPRRAGAGPVWLRTLPLRV